MSKTCLSFWLKKVLNFFVNHGFYTLRKSVQNIDIAMQNIYLYELELLSKLDISYMIDDDVLVLYLLHVKDCIAKIYIKYLTL
jgi:hypothetical protein